MAVGIKFYKSKNYKGFEDSEETINFTIMMNNIFDALNRKFPAEGIKKNSNDIEVSMCLYLCVYICLACLCLIIGDITFRPVLTISG